MRGGSNNAGMLQGGHGALAAGAERGAPVPSTGKAVGPQPHRVGAWAPPSSRMVLADEPSAPTANAGGIFPGTGLLESAGMETATPAPAG